MAGMVNTVPPATIPEVVPMARMLTFSRRVLRRRARVTRNPETPMATMEMGMAVSIPWPTFRATKVAAAAKMTFIRRPTTMDRGVTSGARACAGTMGV